MVHAMTNRTLPTLLAGLTLALTLSACGDLTQPEPVQPTVEATPATDELGINEVGMDSFRRELDNLTNQAKKRLEEVDVAETKRKVRDFTEGAREAWEEASKEAATPTGGKYKREYFGSAWRDTDGNGCDQRNDVLARDLTSPTFHQDGCKVLSGTLQDPYTGERIEHQRGSSQVQIDHLVPLSWAWKHGADQWSEAKRVLFANDLANLTAVGAGPNISKSDSGPEEWVPAAGDSCAYTRSFRELAEGYELTIPPALTRTEASYCR